MKVLGCEVRHIRAMFLMEAGIIGLLGGILGLGVSLRRIRFDQFLCLLRRKRRIGWYPWHGRALSPLSP